MPVPQVIRYATIDVGSNSLLLHVVDQDENGACRVVEDRSEVVRLGEGMQRSCRLSSEAMVRATEVLEGFAELMRQLGVHQVAAVGTMCLRQAANSADFLEQVWKKCGLDIELISGEEEARLSFLGARSGLAARAGRRCVFDVGGGSTELVFGSWERIERRFSLEAGAVYLTEQHLCSDPVTRAELAALQSHLDALLSDLDLGSPGQAVDLLVGMGGTLTSMAAVMRGMERYDPDRVHGSMLSRTEVERQVDLYRDSSVARRSELPGLQPGRAWPILAGASIVLGVMRWLGASRLEVSARGIRHGLMADRFGIQQPFTPRLS